MNNGMVLILILVMSLVTAAIRFAPFVLFQGRETPKYLNYLSQYLPYPIIGMLVVYCLKGMTFKVASGYVPECLAVFVVAALHIWKRNTLLSIFVGTVFYMILKQAIFA